ncbi:MAG: UDP-N-acetylglucosamine 2-epimerase (non-hydrolyzing) [Bacteroidota bacterium]
MKKVLTVVGARPQFVKLAPVARAFEGKFTHIIVHTGQHYDDSMSRVFFEDLSLPEPSYNLGVGSGSHAVQTATMMTALEEVMEKENPDLTVVYGDTNSTLAGALVAAKLNVPVAHIEAGLRSFNAGMPEEINRIITDRVSRFLFCPTEAAMANLAREGLRSVAHLVGDVMLDALISNQSRIEKHSVILERLRIQNRRYYLATIHRASNTDDVTTLAGILKAFGELDAPVILPLHPRTRDFMQQHSLQPENLKNVRFIEPVGYLDMLALQANARKILTDSGGVQKEAYCLKTPCVTLRNETEWVETLEGGWNVLAGVNPESIVNAARASLPTAMQRQPYGDGRASKKIADILLRLVS